MLIEFSVSNYRSIREKLTFSMVAAPRLHKKSNVLKPKIKNEDFPNLLKVAAIYGPNASGKSNFIKALGLVNELANTKPSDQSGLLPVSPFRFDSSLTNEPSTFEIHFITSENRYEFKLSLTSEKIVEEQLNTFVKGKEYLLYKRLLTQFGEEYQFGELLEGGEILQSAWKKLTSSKVLFISQAVANSSDELTQLRIPLAWLKHSLRITPSNMRSLVDVVHAMATQHPELNLNKTISTFLQELDVPVTNIEFDKNDSEASEINSNFDDPSKIDDNDKYQSLLTLLKNNKTTLTHKTALGEALFDIDEESDGTKNLIGFSLPWLMIKSCTSSFDTFVVDELDSSLHPKIVVGLIQKLLQENNGAQLIFTTHDTHLMDAKLLRRDQLWLTERDMNGATQLRSIYDFEGRESEDIEKRYFEGRYRGLPIIR